MGRASGGSNTSHWIRNDIPYFQGAMPVKISIKNERICNQTTMRKRLERAGEVWIVDEKGGFGLDFIKKTERRFRSTTPDMEAVL